MLIFYCCNYLVDTSAYEAHNLLHRNTRHYGIFSHCLWPCTVCRIYKFAQVINFLVEFMIKEIAMIKIKCYLYLEISWNITLYVMSICLKQICSFGHSIDLKACKRRYLEDILLEYLEILHYMCMSFFCHKLRH